MVFGMNKSQFDEVARDICDKSDSFDRLFEEKFGESVHAVRKTGVKDEPK